MVCDVLVSILRYVDYLINRLQRWLCFRKLHHCPGLAYFCQEKARPEVVCISLQALNLD